MAEKQNINNNTLAALGGICTVLFIVVVVGIQGWFYNERNMAIEQVHRDSISYELIEARSKQKERIARYQLLDRERKVYAIPIGEAMRKLVDEQQETASDDR